MFRYWHSYLPFLVYKDVVLPRALIKHLQANCVKQCIDALSEHAKYWNGLF